MVWYDKTNNSSCSVLLHAMYLFRDTDDQPSIRLHEYARTHTHTYVIGPHLFATSYALSQSCLLCTVLWCTCDTHSMCAVRDARQMPCALVLTTNSHCNGNVTLRLAPRHVGWLSEPTSTLMRDLRFSQRCV